ncbi:hypothetical protein OUZ56_026334 [Daphnia magna]|uniref:Uncharacterized protein n=1 Tax=Daphnia magna TaxID=35525 RepID=A0ABQ9ZM75_9CRUS|nr:hypothetical protein OUZ56_026334 [Daphnia magna]
MLIPQECANTSSIWGIFEHTRQLMATDRTGLHSPASDRKCLTLKVGRLSLGHCHGSSRKQHFSFEYRNPHQIRTLSAAAIIALHTQQSLDGTQLPPIPPLLKRETTTAIKTTVKSTPRTTRPTTTTKPITTTTKPTTTKPTTTKPTTTITKPTTRTSRPTATTSKPTTTTTKPTTTTTKSTTTTTKPTTTTTSPTTTATTPTTTYTKAYNYKY